MPKRTASEAVDTQPAVESLTKVKSRSGRVVKPKVWKDGSVAMALGAEDDAFVVAEGSSPHHVSAAAATAAAAATLSSDDDDIGDRSRTTTLRSTRRSATASRPRNANTGNNGGGGVFKQAAIEVLRSELRFMSTGDIARLALKRGLVRQTGKTPEATMASALYTDVKRKGDHSSFCRPAEGMFGLREWMVVDNNNNNHNVNNINQDTTTATHGVTYTVSCVGIDKHTVAFGSGHQGRTNNQRASPLPSAATATAAAAAATAVHDNSTTHINNQMADVIDDDDHRGGGASPRASEDGPATSSDRLMELLCAAAEISKSEGGDVGDDDNNVAAVAAVSDMAVKDDDSNACAAVEGAASPAVTATGGTITLAGGSPQDTTTATATQASSEAASPLPTPKGASLVGNKNNIATNSTISLADVQAAEAAALQLEHQLGSAAAHTAACQWLSVAKMCLAQCQDTMPDALRQTAETALEHAAQQMLRTSRVSGSAGGTAAVVDGAPTTCLPTANRRGSIANMNASARLSDVLVRQKSLGHGTTTNSMAVVTPRSPLGPLSTGFVNAHVDNVNNAGGGGGGGATTTEG